MIYHIQYIIIRRFLKDKVAILYLFSILHSDIIVLTNDIADINNRVQNVLDANYAIMHHVEQVSAVCEGITANTENTFAVTTQSAVIASDAVTMLKIVVDIGFQ